MYQPTVEIASPPPSWNRATLTLAKHLNNWFCARKQCEFAILWRTKSKQATSVWNLRHLLTISIKTICYTIPVGNLLEAIFIGNSEYHPERLIPVGFWISSKKNHLKTSLKTSKNHLFCFHNFASPPGNHDTGIVDLRTSTTEKKIGKKSSSDWGLLQAMTKPQLTAHAGCTTSILCTRLNLDTSRYWSILISSLYFGVQCVQLAKASKCI